MSNSEETQTELEKRYRTAALVVSGQIVLTIIFVAAALMFAPTSQIGTSSNNLTYLWVGALFVAIGAFVLRRMLFRWDRLKDIFLLKGVSGLLASLQKNAILLGAMAEMIAIIGLVIVFLSGNRYEILRAGAIALVVFAINFPHKSVWKKIVANLENI